MTRYPALLAINSEWELLAAGAGDPLASWRAGEPALQAAVSLPAVLELIRADPDTVLAALIQLGAGGDLLAHRVVLQAMLGKLVLLCRRRPERFAEAVSELWVAIAEYPLARRPRSIAANLGWTVLRRLSAAETVSASDLETLPAEPAELSAESTLAEARDLGLIDPLTHRTLWLVYAMGMTSAEAGSRLGLTPEAVRWRCSRALRKLAGEAELLAA